MAIINGNNSNFESEVLNNKGKVVVDFNATWCGPCRMLSPIIEELSESLTDIKFVAVDVDDNGELSEKYEVSAIPCLVLFENGKEVNRNIGFVNKDDLQEFIGGK